jgi:hypothetical protein
MRKQGVGVKGRLMCGANEPLYNAKVKIIDVDTGKQQVCMIYENIILTICFRLFMNKLSN